MKSKIIISLIVLIALQISLSESRNRKLHMRFKADGDKTPSVTASATTNANPQPLPQDLPDINFDGKCDFNEFQQIFTGHAMTRGEIRSVYRIADHSKDAKISQNEWFQFYNLFVLPFEKCDSDKDYQLNKDELSKCFSSDELKDLRLNADDAEEVISILDRTKTSKINFPDYIFLRKGNLAWKECATNEGITKIKMACAIEISAPGRTLDLNEAQQVFDLAIMLRKGQTSNQITLLKFKDYLNVAHIFYYFTEFEIPFQDGRIYKNDVIKALDQQRLPNTLNPEIVKQMYDGFDHLNFAGWAAQAYAHRQFAKFGKKAPGYLQRDEFNALLSQKGFNEKLVSIIDNVKIPSADQINSAALQRNTNQLTERSFLINFLQTSQKKHSQKKSHVKVAPQPANSDPFASKPRDIIFSLLDVYMDGNVRYPIFADFLKFGWMFQNYDTNGNYQLDETDLIDGPKKFESVLPLRKQEIADLNLLTDFIGSHRGYQLNIKEFYSWFIVDDLLNNIRINGNSRSVTRPNLIKGITRMGLRLARFTMNLSQDGGDHQLRQVAYNFKHGFKLALEDEIIANKIINNSQQQPTQPSKK